MILRDTPPLHLTYCTNIHPAQGWAAVDDSLRRVAPALKAALSPQAPFGIGLRLAARDARELLEGDRLRRFRAWLDEQGLYVAIINGFPYGPFHGEPVKTSVYAPDWRTPARVDYTLDLARILAALLPSGMTGGISTVPLSYKKWMASASAGEWDAIVANVVAVGRHLMRLRDDTGVHVHLDIEPEPDCSLETADEAVAFFEDRLRPAGGARIDDHVQLCFDCCHCAVEYEDPIDALARLRKGGVRIGRVQLSSALKVPMPRDAAAAHAIADRLAPFADSTYLHQVVEREGEQLRRFADLDVALSQEAAGSARRGQDREWRIHFHVPLFTGEYQGLGSSQNLVSTMIREARERPFTQHLEIETYTWSVLPDGLRMEIGASIAREYRWVLDQWRLA